MQILLINPDTKMPVDQRSSPPLGLAYLAAVAAKRGDEVRVCDMEIENETVGRLIDSYRPDVVGITAMTVQIKRAWTLAEEIKPLSGAYIVLGGMHPTLMPDESLWIKDVDAVVRGEGEATWLELLDKLEHGQSMEGVDGLSYRESGRIQHNRDRQPIMDLDAIPYPAYEYFKMDHYTNLQPHVDARAGLSFAMITARGCPYRCSYCPHVFPRKWRARSPRGVVDEFKHLVEHYGAREIGILDDSFNVNRNRVHDICRLLIEENLSHVPWIVINGMRANLADYETLKLMKEAGCKRAAFGVESGNQNILDNVVDKHLKLAEIREAFDAAKRAKLETIGFFILGLPGDTAETMDETIRFACELNPDVANFFVATPYPGTPMYDLVKKNGRLLSEDWDDFFILGGKARFEMDGLSPELVERKWREAFRRFYLRPSRLCRLALQKQTWANLTGMLRLAGQVFFKREISKSAETAPHPQVELPAQIGKSALAAFDPGLPFTPGPTPAQAKANRRREE